MGLLACLLLVPGIPRRPCLLLTSWSGNECRSSISHLRQTGRHRTTSTGEKERMRSVSFPLGSVFVTHVRNDIPASVGHSVVR